MILNRIIKRITKISKFEVKAFTTVSKWKMPFFYSQEGVKGQGPSYKLQAYSLCIPTLKWSPTKDISLPGGVKQRKLVMSSLTPIPCAGLINIHSKAVYR